MQKICNCGYETNKKSFIFCPLCGNKLVTLELEPDGTYKAERKACRVINGDMINPEKIYYYKVSSIDSELVWVYESPTSMHWIFGCHISKIRPYELEKIERCVFRENNKCGYASTCKRCPVYKGDIDDYIISLVNVENGWEK